MTPRLHTVWQSLMLVHVYVCIFVAHDGKRCKPPTYHSLEGFHHVGIFQLFVVKLESCVFWLAVVFLSGEGRRLSSASYDHFQCLLLENFVFWQCSLLIGRHSWEGALPIRSETALKERFTLPISNFFFLFSTMMVENRQSILVHVNSLKSAVTMPI